jgi:hypothetical protein
MRRLLGREKRLAHSAHWCRRSSGRRRRAGARAPLLSSSSPSEALSPSDGGSGRRNDAKPPLGGGDGSPSLERGRACGDVGVGAERRMELRRWRAASDAERMREPGASGTTNGGGETGLGYCAYGDVGLA